MKALKQYIKYSSSVVIFIPTKQQDGHSVSNLQQLEDTTLKSLTDLFGGATVSNALGSYQLETGKVQREKVLLCESFTQNLTPQLVDKVITICEDLKKNANQESIALKVNGNLYFI